MTLLAQEFKKALLKAQENYITQFSDKKIMPLHRSQEVAHLVDLLRIVEDPIDLYKQVFSAFMNLKLSIFQRFLNISGSVLHKELKFVFDHFDLNELRD